jgi:hypothetical protein
MTFNLSNLEQQRYSNFTRSHIKCWNGTVEKLDSTVLIVIPTGIGNLVSCRCSECVVEEDITDFEEIS